MLSGNAHYSVKMLLIHVSLTSTLFFSLTLDPPGERSHRAPDSLTAGADLSAGLAGAHQEVPGGEGAAGGTAVPGEPCPEGEPKPGTG